MFLHHSAIVQCVTEVDLIHRCSPAGRQFLSLFQRAAINDTIKDVVKTSGLKMPQLAMPLRHIVTGRSQTPSIDAVLELLGREMVLTRLAQHLETD